MRARYWATLLLGWPILDLAARTVQSVITGDPWHPELTNGVMSTPVQLWWTAPVILLVNLVIDAGPVGEEPGWLGCALPRMIDGRRGQLSAAVMLGVIGGVWHLPAFLVAGTHQRDNQMGVYWLIMSTTLSSVIMAWPYLATVESVLVPGRRPPDGQLRDRLALGELHRAGTRRGLRRLAAGERPPHPPGCRVSLSSC